MESRSRSPEATPGRSSSARPSPASREALILRLAPISLLTASLLTLAPAVALADSQVVTDQVSSSYVTQTATAPIPRAPDNRSTISQAGSGNSALTEQLNAGNGALISQAGVNNSSAIHQLGIGGSAASVQQGSGLDVVITQTSNASVVTVTQSRPGR